MSIIPVSLDLILLNLIGFGAWISYSDLKRGQIKNYMAFFLVLTAFFLNIFVTRAFVSFPLESLSNIFFGILAAVVIWVAGLWSAADAKLFIAINCLLPVTAYRAGSGLFPGFNILINFSLPLFFLFLFHAWFKTGWPEKGRALAETLRLEIVARVILIVAALYSLTFFMISLFHLKTEYFLRLVLLVVFFWFLEKKLKISLEQFCAVFLLFIIIFVPSFLTHRAIISVAILSLAVLFSLCLLSLATPLYAQSVRIEDLREGMVLTEMVFRKKGRYAKQAISFNALMSLLNQRFRHNPVFGYNPDGLDLSDVRTIQSLSRQNRLDFDEIKISKTIPFAPVLFLAGFLTYFFKGSFLLFFWP